MPAVTGGEIAESQGFVRPSEKPQMNRSGTSTFTNPDDYQAGIGGASLGGTRADFTIIGGREFKARLTWLNLHHLRVVRGSEDLPRIAYISLPPDRSVFSFPTSAPPVISGGIELRVGDILFRGRGERVHQRTIRDSKWGLISLPLEQLAASGKA
jgi:hypothetical protein